MKDLDVDGKEQKMKKRSCFKGLQLIIVQSSVCIAVVMISLLLKVIGGDVFADLSNRFRDAMLHHTVVSAAVSTNTHTDPVQEFTQVQVTAESQETVSPLYCAPFNGGVITSSFGSRSDPFDANAADVHQGVDIAAPSGTDLAALQAGTVTQVGYEEYGYGHFLEIAVNGGYSYLYAHCQEITVTVGQKVETGEKVAVVGSSGRSTGSHLHFEWRDDGVPIDPMTVLPKETYA